MTSGPLIFLCVNAVALLTVPRRWAPLPFIMTACYLSIDQSIELGSVTFTAIRILIAVGVLRVVLRGERLVGGINGLDWWLIVWSLWASLSGMFHENPNETLINRLGLVYNTLGIYVLLRIFCSSIEDVVGLSKATAVLLLPVAVEMLYEAAGYTNLFYAFEGTTRSLYVREERIRAFGPFAHPILAGTVGAVCLPLMVAMWRLRPVAARAGVAACAVMVVTCASSGPLMSAAASVGALAMWRYRYRMKSVRWLAAATYVALAIAMKAPVYYLIARINFVGGSTGYHRALLIESAITYLNEWWLTGTDYTRHWAPSPGFSPQHTDITNQYLSMGVMGGIPLLLLFIAGLVKAFSLLGARIREQGDTCPTNQFVLWALGSALFAHCVTFLSVSYFDQSFLFLYLTLAAIGSARMQFAAAPVVTVAPALAETPEARWRRLQQRPGGLGAGHHWPRPDRAATQ